MSLVNDFSMPALITCTQLVWNRQLVICYVPRVKPVRTGMDNENYLSIGVGIKVMSQVSYYSDYNLHLLLLTCLFRYIKADEFLEKAVENYKQCRQIPLDGSDWKRDDMFITENPDLGQKHCDPTWIVDFQDALIGSNKEEEKFLQAFMDKAREDSLLVRGELDMTRALPAGAPLLQHLRANVKLEPSGWLYPSRIYLDELSRKISIDNDTCKGIEMFEITLPPKQDEMSEKDFMDRVQDLIKEDRTRFPVDFLSVSIESVPTTSTGFKALLKSDPKKLVHIPKGVAYEDTFRVPTRILMGNGTSWMASIRFPVSFNPSENTYSVKLQDFDPKILDLKNLAEFVTGTEEAEELDLLYKFLEKVYKLKLDPPMYLDLRSLAVYAGWRFESLNKWTLNLICLGGLIPYIQGYNKYDLANLEMQTMPETIKSQKVASIRIGHSVCVVLMSMFVRNAFPEPAGLCTIIKMQQRDAMRWVTWLIANGLKHLVPDILEFKDTIAKGRQHVKFGFRNVGLIKADPPKALERLDPVIPFWSSVTYGNARDLHNARYWYVGILTSFFDIFENKGGPIEQHPMLKATYGKRTLEEEFNKLTFGRVLTDHNTIEGVDKPGLNVRKEFEPLIFKLDVNAVTDQDIRMEATRTKQSWRYGLIEQCLIDPDFRYKIIQKLQTLGDQLDDFQYTFFRTRVVIYQDLREQELYQNGRMTQAVDYLELKAKEAVKNAVQNETQAKDRSKNLEIAEERDSRIQLMHARAADQSTAPSVGSRVQQHAYHVLPGRNAAKNKKRKDRMKAKRQILFNQDKWMPHYMFIKQKCDKAQAIKSSTKSPAENKDAGPVKAVEEPTEKSKKADMRAKKIQKEIEKAKESLRAKRQAKADTSSSSSSSSSQSSNSSDESDVEEKIKIVETALLNKRKRTDDSSSSSSEASDNPTTEVRTVRWVGSPPSSTQREVTPARRVRFRMDSDQSAKGRTGQTTDSHLSGGRMSRLDLIPEGMQVVGIDSKDEEDMAYLDQATKETSSFQNYF